MRSEVSPVIRIIKRRHAVREQHRVPCLDVLAGNHPDAARPDAHGRVAHVVRRDQGVLRGIDLVAGVALQIFTGGEHRRLARAELLAPHLARLEIVVDVFAQPDLAAHLNAHVAVGHRLAGLPVTDALSAISSVSRVSHINAVRRGHHIVGVSSRFRLERQAQFHRAPQILRSPVSPARERCGEASRPKKSARRWRAIAAPEAGPPLIHASRGCFWFAGGQHRPRPRRRAIVSFGAAN